MCDLRETVDGEGLVKRTVETLVELMTLLLAEHENRSDLVKLPPAAFKDMREELYNVAKEEGIVSE